MGKDLASIIQAAAPLMTEEFNQKVNSKIGKSSGGFNNNGGISNEKEIEAAIFGFSNETYSGGDYVTEATNTSPVLSEDGINRLPEFMRESFRKNPPMSAGQEFDRVKNEELDRLVAKSAATANLIPEETAPIHRPVAQTVGYGIDYNYIKYLIEEAVNNALSKASLLNESKSSSNFALSIGKGSKIRFMDTKGNIYEGELKLKQAKR